MTASQLVLLVVVAAGLAASAAGYSCSPPFSLVGDQCLYVEFQVKVSWEEARNQCQDRGGDLATFPSCDDFTIFTRLLTLEAPLDTKVWVGATTVFGPNMWQWISGESLQTGVPFWTSVEDHDSTEECAAANNDYYYRLSHYDCSSSLSFVCSQPVSPQAPPQPAPRPGEGNCPPGGVLIGDFCYVFNNHAETWTEAEKRCGEAPEQHGGLLFYPASCDEFTNMAHHLEAAETSAEYWVGAVDISGHSEWTWLSGDEVPGGTPYWATGEPSHELTDAPWQYCGFMDSGRRYYLGEAGCGERRPYICKVPISASGPVA